MTTKELTCINCPLGCALTVVLVGDAVREVRGNQCRRGDAYAREESVAPMRVLTTTVRLRNGDIRRLPVKTAAPVPKDRLIDCSRALAGVEIEAPVTAGQLVLSDVCGLGVEVVATRSIGKIK